MAVNENLKKLRAELNLSQDEMAYQLGMSKNGYGKLERNETKMTVERLEQIVNKFNIDVNEFIKSDKDFKMAFGDNNRLLSKP